MRSANFKKVTISVSGEYDIESDTFEFDDLALEVIDSVKGELLEVYNTPEEFIEAIYNERLGMLP